MPAYYNEIDPYAAQWLRNLIAAGHIAPGDVDERSIVDVRASDLLGYTQCHFFAGIGVWSYALRLAGWSDERPVWTGSCPCQPFSAAGRGEAFSDPRHLWPSWAGLIAQRKPCVVFGEQVASKDGDAWLDLVHTDLEAMGYACGPVVLPAAGFGAPHGRHRLFFVADPASVGQPGRRECHGGAQEGAGRASAIGGELREQAAERGPVGGFWANAEWIGCLDGKARPVEPGTFPLADGASDRVGRLRAYGNAISPHVAAEFIRAYDMNFSTTESSKDL